MILRQILILIVSALALFFSHRYYSQTFCPQCCVDKVAVAPIEKSQDPLLFNWNKAETITNEKFAGYRAGILADGSDGETLEITGSYFADEENDTEYDNLGLARAEAIGLLLKEENNDLQYIIKSEVVDKRDGVETELFKSASFNWISGEESKEERIEIDIIGDAKILFPFNSSDKIDSPEVENYLDSIAEKLKSDNSLTVYIVGYTDSLGEPGPNRRLSERRAKKIRDILRRNGVPRKQIVTSGRGEADAVAPNTSEASRQLNRRVEIKIQ